MRSFRTPPSLIGREKELAKERLKDERNESGKRRRERRGDVYREEDWPFFLICFRGLDIEGSKRIRTLRPHLWSLDIRNPANHNN